MVEKSCFCVSHVDGYGGRDGQREDLMTDEEINDGLTPDESQMKR